MLRRNYFRLAIVMVVFSVFYDLYWFMQFSGEYSKDIQDAHETYMDVYHK